MASNLIIETMEPRLLLSVSVSANAVQALHDNLHNFAVQTLLHAETMQALALHLPGVAIGETHNIGSLAAISSTFDGSIATPIAEVIAANLPANSSIDSGVLATKIHDQIVKDMGTAAGNAVTVTDTSTAGHLQLGFAVGTDKVTPFTLDFGQAGATYGIHLPQVSGMLDTALSFNFDVALGFSGTAVPDFSAFSLTPHVAAGGSATSAFNVSVEAKADLTGATVDLGLLTLTAGGTAAAPVVLDVAASIGFSLSGGLDGTSINAGVAPTVVTAVSHETGTAAASVLLDVPLTLTADHAIPGIPSITTTMHLVLAGQAAEGNFTVDTSGIQHAFATAMGDPSFDISTFNRYTTSDLINALTTVDGYLSHLAGVSALSIPIPFAEGLTVGGVLDLAAQFQTQVIDPLTSVAGILGFGEHQTNAVTLTGSAPDLSHLPSVTSLHLIASGGTPAATPIDVTLTVGNTYLNTQNVATHIVSADDMVTAVNQAIGKTTLAGVVQAFDLGGKLSLSLIDAGHMLTSLQLVAPAAALGFTSATTAAAPTTPTTLDGLNIDIGNLPPRLGLHIALDDGIAHTTTTTTGSGATLKTTTTTTYDTLSVDITIGSTYLDTAGHLQPITTLDNLVTALNQAIKSSTLYGYVQATNVGGHIELTLTDPSKVRTANDPPAAINQAYKTITVSSPGGSTAFADLRDFGITLAETLNLPGTSILKSLTASAADKAAAATNLMTELGFGYDAVQHELTWSVVKEFDNLISANVPFSTSLDLGSVASLSITNASLLVTSSVIANLTLGLDLSGTFAGTFIDTATLLATGTPAVTPKPTLTGPTLLDRLSFQHTGITATIDASIVPTIAGTLPTILGTLGPFTFTASPSTLYVSLKASLFLNDSDPVAVNAAADADPSIVSFTRLQTSLKDGDFSSFWAFNLTSGRDGLPFADLKITDISVSALGKPLTLGQTPDVEISINNPADLLSALHMAHPVIAIHNFSPNLSVADILSGIQTVFSLLDTSVATQKLPLINASLDDILTLAQNINTAITAAQNDPVGSLSTIQGDINHALGGDYVHLTIDAAATHLQVALNYSPGTLNEQLPFNFDLGDLATFLGASSTSSIGLLAAQLGTLASASGTLQVTATANVALTFGIDLRSTQTPTPAALTDKLASLNAGKGLRTDAGGLADLQVTRADGSVFTVNVGKIAGTPTVADLVAAINTAAGGTGFATYNATTGVISFTDTTHPASASVAALGLGAAVDGGAFTSTTITSAVITADLATKAYSFSVNLAGQVYEVDVAADTGRTTPAEFAEDVRAALNATNVDATLLKAAGVTLPGGFSPSATSPSLSLAQFVRVITDASGHLVFVIRDTVLGHDSHAATNVFAITDIATPTAGPSSAFEITSINGSHIALDLGLGSDSVTFGGTGARVISGKLEEAASVTDRFTLDTGLDSQGHLQTGLSAYIGIVGTNLNFTVGIGALSASIVNGTATFGKDLGHVAAGNPNFHAGNGLTDPAEFLISLNDGTANTAIGFSKLRTLHVAASANAALDVELPVQVFGIPAGTISAQVNNLFGTLGPVDAAGAAILAPRDYKVSSQLNLDNFSPASILNDPETLIAGLDQFLGLLDSGVAQQVYNLDIPLVGKVFLPVGAFFSTLHNAVIGELNTLVDDFRASHPGQPVTTQNIVTQGLNYVLNDVLHLPGTITSYIDSFAHPTVLSFLWTFSDKLLDVTPSVSSDLGIPGLGLQLAGLSAHVTATLNVSLGFGYMASAPGAPGGFFLYDTGTFQNAAGVTAGRLSVTPNNLPNLATLNFQTSHALDLKISVALQIPDAGVGFNLGFLRMIATAGATASTFTGDLFIDIGPQETTGHLFFRDFGKGNVVNVLLAANLNVDLMLTADLSTAVLPSVSAEFLFGYSYDKLLTKTLDFQLMDPTGHAYASGVTTPLSFMNVSVDLGSFLSGFLKPILADIELVIGPLRPILDFLNQPIPGISQLIGDTSILDIAALVEPGPVATARTFIAVIDEVDTLAKSIGDLPNGSHVLLPFGNFVFGDAKGAANTTSLGGGAAVDPFKGGSLKSINLASALASVTTDPTALLNTLPGGIGTKLATLRPTSYTDKSSTSTGGSFDLPILHSPMAALQMLMGQVPTIDLVHWTLPVFDFSFTKGIHVTFFGIPHVAEIGGDIIFNVGATIRLAFGYDTTGIIQFLGDHNPLDFFNGLYIDDTQGPQLVLHASITGQLGLDIVLIKAGIGATLSAEVDFQFADFSHTGKVRLSTVLDELISNPQDIFVVHGELDVKIYLWVWVGVDTFLFGTITFYEASYNLFGPTTIFSFGYDPTTQTPVALAHQDSGSSTLDLNIGSHADRQETGDNTNNPNQTFTVTGAGTNAVDVTSGGVTQHYTNVTAINADLGSGNNTVKFTGNVSANVNITGGDGTNTVDLGGVIGDPTITLGNGNNTVYAAAAPTTIVVGNGNNRIFASDSGTTTITTGDGNNVVTGGTTVTASDTITVGDGNNVIYGGSGNDIITAGNGGSGSNVIYGADGTNTISIHGSGANIIFGHGAHNAQDTTTDTVTATQISVNTITAGGTSVINAGAGNDIIFGVSGNNTINGGAGHDTIFGAGGTVTLDGHGGIVRAFDLTAGGGNNTIFTGNGGSVVIGGGGDNTITGGAGADILIGGTGSVDGASGGAAGHYSITATADAGGTDTIKGMGGDDVILGGIGVTTLDGGNGADIILGHDGIVVRDAAAGSVSAPAHLVSIQTTDETQGGTATIVGGAGNDVIFGGAGANTLDAGAGTDIVVGHFGTLDATNAGRSIVVSGRDGALAGNGNDTITASQNAIIIGGGGNNTITTTDTISFGSATLPAGDTDVNDSAPPVTPTDRTVVVFGANGTVTFDYLRSGGIGLHSAATVEDQVGGANTITVGNGGDFVFGGAGSNRIIAGTQIAPGTSPAVGDAVILGHVGSVVVSSTTGLTTVTEDGAATLIAAGNDVIDAYGNALIILGAGDNTVTTHDQLLTGQASFEWSETVVAGAGAAVYSYGSAGQFWIHSVATTIGLEDASGSNRITVGDGNDIVIGGAGGSTITAGNGDDIILGHLGAINLDALYSPDATGATPDVISYTNGQDGAVLQVPGGMGVSASHIIAGNGSDIVMGGAGDNTINLGDGNDIVFGASGAVTRDGRLGTNDPVFATTTEDALGGNNIIVVGNGNDAVFGGAGANIMTIGNAALGFNAADDIVLGHAGHVTWASDHQSVTVVGDGVLPSAFFAGNDTINAYQNTLVITGGGDNTVTTHDQTGTIPSAQWTEVVIGGAATATMSLLTSGQFQLVSAQTLLFQEDFGGANRITVGDGADVVIGGSGRSVIVAGNGDDVILGHLGELHFDRMANPDATGAAPDVLGYATPQDQSDLVFLGARITAGNGHNVIVGGNGDNIITTGDGGSVIFGAAGTVTRDGTQGGVVIEAHTTEELFGGDNTITTGDGDNVIFGGRGYNTITAGTGVAARLGNDIILGHAGRVAYSPDLQYVTVTGGPANGTPDVPSLTGFGDDVISATASAIIIAGSGSDVITTHDHATAAHRITEFTEVVLGDSGVVVAGIRSSGQFLLNVATVAGVDAGFGGNDTITVGDSNAVVIDGAGQNVITTGNGSAVVVAGFGVVVEDPVAHSLLSASLLGRGLGFLDSITVGNDSAQVIGSNNFTVLNPSPHSAVVGPMHLISGSETLAAGTSLSDLAASIGGTTVIPATASAPAPAAPTHYGAGILPGSVIGPSLGSITPAAPVIHAYVLDTVTGHWLPDLVPEALPLLMLDDNNAFVLDLWGDLLHEALPGLTIAA